jgi:hypothetical protein
MYQQNSIWCYTNHVASKLNFADFLSRDEYIADAVKQFDLQLVHYDLPTVMWNEVKNVYDAMA